MKALSALLLLVLSVSALAEPLLTEVISTTRNAAELVSVLDAMAKPEGSVSAYRNQLVIRSTETKLQAIRAVLSQLDRPPRNLLVQVRKSGSADLRSRSGHIGNDGIEIRNISSRNSSSTEQGIRIMEGEAAHISTGEERLQLSSISTGINSGVGFSATRTERGIHVQPRIAGEQVQLSIRIINERPAGSGMEYEQAETVITTTLGEWTPLGGVNESRKETGQGISWRTKNKSDIGSNIEVRVDIAD